MAKYTYSSEVHPVSEEFVLGCTKLPVRYRGGHVVRAITAFENIEGKIGGLVIDPVNKDVTGVWAWAYKDEPNVRFLSYREVDENGNYRLHKGGSPLCNAIREFINRNWSFARAAA